MNKIGLVLSGGGVRGVAHLGAIKALHEMGIEPDIVSGTSAGSIVSTMYAAGHSLDSIFEVFTNTSIFKMTHFATLKRLPSELPGLIKRPYTSVTNAVATEFKELEIVDCAAAKTPATIKPATPTGRFCMMKNGNTPSFAGKAGSINSRLL